jgi:hypothetical protein
VPFNCPADPAGKLAELRSGMASLLQIGIGPFVQCLDDHLFPAPSGEQDERYVVACVSQLPEEGQTVHLRHHVVRDDHVVTALAQFLKSSKGAVGGLHNHAI